VADGSPAQLTGALEGRIVEVVTPDARKAIACWPASRA
jgi:hypothetical protein